MKELMSVEMIIRIEEFLEGRPQLRLFLGSCCYSLAFCFLCYGCYLLYNYIKKK